MHSMIKIPSLTLMFFMLALTYNVEAESLSKLSSTYQQYINTYSDLAVKKQKEYGIPASITLAQGLLESGAGQSKLAKNANNHFGIKCHDWSGPTIYHDDDKKGECFRKYKYPEESYSDHSLFLKERSRYSELFKLSSKDYKGWAKGLQKYGYATDKTYANKLIKLIEDYELYRFDSGTSSSKTSSSGKTSSSSSSSSKKNEPAKATVTRASQKMYGLTFVYAQNNDTFEKIAAETGVKVKSLKSFNEIPGNFPLQRGDIVYLEKKKKKADKPYYDHVVKTGESMHDIAQMYGVQMKNIYKLNKKKDNYVPSKGDVLKLR